MDVISAILLGFIQGATEFIPVSSSGHLILVRDFLSISSANDLAFDAVLQLATTLAVAVYFRADLLRLLKSAVSYVRGIDVAPEEKILLGALLFGTVPAVIAGLLLEGWMETVFRSTALVSVTLLLGALLMYVAERVARQTEVLSVKSGIAIGFFQVLALVPGMSRSGSTIAGGLFMGLTRATATRFSFLLSFPILLGSGVKKFIDLISLGAMTTGGLELFIGCVTAFFVGLGAIHFLISYLQRRTLSVFIWYRVVLAAVLLVSFW